MRARAPSPFLPTSLSIGSALLCCPEKVQAPFSQVLQLVRRGSAPPHTTGRRGKRGGHLSLTKYCSEINKHISAYNLSDMLFFLKETHLIINRKLKWYAQLGTILKVTEAVQSEKYFLITCIWSTLRFLNPGKRSMTPARGTQVFKQEITAIPSVILSDWSSKPILQFVLVIRKPRFPEIQSHTNTE